MITSTLFGVLLALALWAPAHPHHPHVNVVEGAAGQRATLFWFTVDYNAESVATLPAGSDWHLVMSRLTTGMALRCGDVEIAAGDYKLNARKSGDGGFDRLVLIPWELFTAQRTRGPDRDDAVEAARRSLAERGIAPEITVPISAYEAPDAEHLEMAVLQRGYRTARHLQTSPTSGIRFSILIDFGPLHRRLDLEEVWAAAGDGK